MDEQTPQETPEPLAENAVAPTVRTRHRRRLLIGGATAVAVGLAAGGIGVAAAVGGHAEAQAAAQPATIVPGGYRSGAGGYGGGGGGRYGGYGSSGGSAATPATTAQEAGVVTVVSRLGYDGTSEAAGTGMILTSGGEVLTNNHVVEDSTSITVTVESTGESYTAEVVGTDATDDVAVLQLVDSSGADVTGLMPIAADPDGAAVGEAVTDVGNAEGTGNLVTASGTVTALGQTIQVADDSTGAEKTLSGLLELDADIVAGDSGGPLLDADGEVVGMATAASSGTAQVTGYAIPIQTAMAIVDRIVAGDASGTVMIGLPAFLGVELSAQQDGTGVAVAGAIDGMPAAQAGIAAGSLITAVDGVAVAQPDDLSSAIAAHRVGDRVTISWTDATGAAHQSVVSLVAGPAA